MMGLTTTTVIINQNGAKHLTRMAANNNQQYEYHSLATKQKSMPTYCWGLAFWQQLLEEAICRISTSHLFICSHTCLSKCLPIHLCINKNRYWQW